MWNNCKVFFSFTEEVVFFVSESERVSEFRCGVIFIRRDFTLRRREKSHVCFARARDGELGADARREDRHQATTRDLSLSPGEENRSQEREGEATRDVRALEAGRSLGSRGGDERGERLESDTRSIGAPSAASDLSPRWRARLTVATTRSARFLPELLFRLLFFQIIYSKQRYVDNRS